MAAAMIPHNGKGDHAPSRLSGRVGGSAAIMN
jgi:hypothetical protein